MKKLPLLFFLSLFVAQLFAQVPAQLIQHPDVSQTQICFIYGDDLWIVDKNGGNATKLASPKGREANPQFSPDGKEIAFEANYDGNNDIYKISTMGGVPQRVTGHGMYERIMDWYSDGKHLLYASSAESGKQRFMQFYKISSEGGLPEKLPIMVGALASISADGEQIAFSEKSRLGRSWKRYRGGTAPDIHIMNLKTLASENITNNDANDEMPMWYKGNLYYLSDKGPALRHNIWMYDTKTKQHTQLTKFTDHDVHLPSIGPEDLVFQAAGKLHLMKLSDHSIKEVKINAVGDFSFTRPSMKDVSKRIFNYNISPDGNRAIFEARGDIFSLPKKEGFVKNLTRTSGVAERHPAWSPDGEKIAYFSDRSGEYELTLYDVKTGKEKKVSNLGKGYRYQIYWSPDSKKVVFVDQAMYVNLYDIEAGTNTKVDQGSFWFEGPLRGFSVSWAPDSRWFTYANSLENRNGAIFIYDTKEKKKHQVTSGFFADNQAVFGPEGKYLVVSTNRNISPIYSDFDNTWVYANATGVALVPLKKDTPSPLAPKNDEQELEDEEAEKEEEKDKDEKGKKDKEEEKDGDEKEEDEEDKVEPVEIDFEDFESRMVMLPVETGNVSDIDMVKGKVIFLKFPNSGSEDEDAELKYFDLEEREEKTIISGIYNFKIAANGEKMIVQMPGRQFAIISVGADQKAKDKVPTSEMAMMVDPRAEWKQMFQDAWRLERDFFYDEKMHGVDWNEMKTRYGKMIDYTQSRSDVNFIIGELIGELNASHTYRGGGDSERADRKNVGYLGADYVEENGGIKIKKIIKPAPWNMEVRSPLAEPGVDVQEGDYLLAVNGIPMSEYRDPWIAMTGMAGKTVELTVNKTMDFKDARKVLVKPIRSETRLRNLAWIESNRKKVDEMSNGKIGYIYVPSTGFDGQKELITMFYGQWHKPGLIVDERFNNGGQIPDRFVELLNRKPLAYFKVRDGKDWQWPPIGHFGPKAMLINGWSGSGGDAFPDYFRKSGLGPLIGTRTWGGLIGISGAPTLIDGGGITVPTFRMYDPDGEWFKEGYGVDPDIEVKENPTALAKGTDVQLERAVQEVMKKLDEVKEIHPKRPTAENRSK